jgi:hypothetical protein
MDEIYHPAITVGELQMHGVKQVLAACGLCDKRWFVPIDFLPTGTNLMKIAELLICPACGGRSIKASPETANNR